MVLTEGFEPSLSTLKGWRLSQFVHASITYLKAVHSHRCGLPMLSVFDYGIEPYFNHTTLTRRITQNLYRFYSTQMTLLRPSVLSRSTQYLRPTYLYSEWSSYRTTCVHTCVALRLCGEWAGYLALRERGREETLTLNIYIISHLR